MDLVCVEVTAVVGTGPDGGPRGCDLCDRIEEPETLGAVLRADGSSR